MVLVKEYFALGKRGRTNSMFEDGFIANITRAKKGYRVELEINRSRFYLNYEAGTLGCMARDAGYEENESGILKLIQKPVQSIVKGNKIIGMRKKVKENGSR